MIPSDLGIIFGGSKPSHIDKTLEYKLVCLIESLRRVTDLTLGPCSAEGPLPDEVVTAYKECYKKVRGQLPNYHHDPAWYDPKSHGYREPPKIESGL
jgi:aflatoxin B1 aldehyde reductase